MDLFELISSEEKPFANTKKGWKLHDEDNEEAPMYTKETISSLLEFIDKLVHKEKQLKHSSHEECREMEDEIHALGDKIQSTTKVAKKANRSPRSGFPIFLDSQPTPSQLFSKRSKGPSLEVEGMLATSLVELHYSYCITEETKAHP